MPRDSPDFRLVGFQPADGTIEERYWQELASEEVDLAVLAEHHTADRSNSYYVLHDEAATWGIPGEPQIIALHIQRDPTARTFRFDRNAVALSAMAQSWLIARGCPNAAIDFPADKHHAPADAATKVLAERLKAGSHRLDVLGSYTDDETAPFETIVFLQHRDPRTELPYRIVVESLDPATWTYTLREGSFPTFKAADDWWDAHVEGETPALPAIPAAAPRARSAVALPASPAPSHRRHR